MKLPVHDLFATARALGPDELPEGDAPPAGASVRIGTTRFAADEVRVVRDVPREGVVVSVGFDAVAVWDRRTGYLRRLFHFPRGFPDATPVLVEITGAGDVVWQQSGRLMAWRFASGAVDEVVELRGRPKCLVIAPDGQHAATYHDSTHGREAKITVYALDAGEVVAELDAPFEDGFAVELSPDGTRLLISRDFSAQSGSDWIDFVVVEVASGRTLLSESQTCWMQSVFFSPRGRQVLFGEPGKTAERVYAIEGRARSSAEIPVFMTRSLHFQRQRIGIEERARRIPQIGVSADGRYVATSSWVWDRERGERIDLEPGPYSDALAVAVRGMEVIRLYSSGLIKRFSLETRRPLRDGPKVKPQPDVAAFSADATRLAILDWTRAPSGLCLKSASGKFTTTLKTRLTPDRKFSVAWAPSGGLVAAGAHGRVVVWSVEDGEVVADVPLAEAKWWSRAAKGREPVSHTPDELAWSADSRWLAARATSVGQTGAVFLSRDLGPFEPVIFVTMRAQRPLALAFVGGADDPRLAVGRADGTIDVWRVDPWSHIARFDPAHLAMVTALACTPDGTTLVSGSADGTALLWPVGP